MSLFNQSIILIKIQSSINCDSPFVNSNAINKQKASKELRDGQNTPVGWTQRYYFKNLDWGKIYQSNSFVLRSIATINI